MTLDTLPLDGVPYEIAKCFGMPHVSAFYSSSSVHSHKREEDARCAICKSMATNAHHEPPKGMGGKYSRFLLRTPMGQFILKPALIAMCGSGTTGCHGDRHNGEFKIRWVWEKNNSKRAGGMATCFLTALSLMTKDFIQWGDGW